MTPKERVAKLITDLVAGADPAAAIADRDELVGDLRAVLGLAIVGEDFDSAPGAVNGIQDLARLYGGLRPGESAFRAIPWAVDQLRDDAERLRNLNESIAN
jgi:hypothetical protein